jgi:Tfp pilus assembly protein PilF
MYAANQADAALPLLSEALAIDPTFAMAHRLIARVHETSGNAAKQTEHLARAYEHRNSLTENERYHVEASYFKGKGEYEKAVATLTAATSLFPADGDLRYELALAYRDSNETARAIEQLDIILKSAPLTTAAYGDLVLLRAKVDDYDGARVAYEEARKRDISAPKLEWGHGMILLGEGRHDEARAVLARVKDAGGVYAGIARLYLAATDILEGKLESASRQLEFDVLLDSTDANDRAEFTRRALLARILLLQERRGDAQKQLGTMLAMVSKQPPAISQQERFVTGKLLVELGELPRAKLLLRQLEQARTSAFAQNCYHGLAGEIALAESRSQDAVLAFSAAAQYPLFTTRQALARAHAAQKDWSSARGAWAQVIASKGDALREHLAAEWVLAHLELARASRAAGDVAAAREQYDRFLTLWKNGDDLPIVQTAAAEQRNLSNSR